MSHDETGGDPDSGVAAERLIQLMDQYAQVTVQLKQICYLTRLEDRFLLDRCAVVRGVSGAR